MNAPEPLDFEEDHGPDEDPETDEALDAELGETAFVVEAGDDPGLDMHEVDPDLGIYGEPGE